METPFEEAFQSFSKWRSHLKIGIILEYFLLFIVQDGYYVITRQFMCNESSNLSIGKIVESL